LQYSLNRVTAIRVPNYLEPSGAGIFILKQLEYLHGKRRSTNTRRWNL